VKVVAFVGYHDSGKTTLAEKVARLLKEKGYKVCYLKHDPKGHGLTDKEGSDTYRLFPFCYKTALLSPDRLTLWERGSLSYRDVLERYFKDCEVVLLEGFKGVKELPKVAVGEVEAEGIVLRVDEKTKPEDIIKLIERLEDFK